MDGICELCKGGLENGKPTVQLREKGSNGINRASADRGDGIITAPGQYVHVDCRKNYCNPNVIHRVKNKTPDQSMCMSPALRSNSEQFTFKDNCLFCGQTAKLSGSKRGIDVFAVRTLQFQTLIQTICRERSDDWSMEVGRRLNTVTDLPAADAIYHQSCNVNFRTMKSIPAAYSHNNSKRFRGRPADTQSEESFKYVVKYLEENDEEQITVRDLVQKMKEICGDAAYSVIYMKQKLKDHFGDNIIITEINGKSNVVTLRSTASSILHDFYQRQESENSDDRKIDIIKTAAKLILSDIKSKDFDKTMYPSPFQLSSVEQNIDYLPDSLNVFLQTMFTHKNADVKLASIGQAIVQAARPRISIAPLQIGLGVQLHHQFASKFLIETLNTLGFCASYSEVQKFELSAAVSTGTDIPHFIPGTFMQYVADNVDHNVRTLDGHGTFHGMGIIVCVTPGTTSDLPVKRLNVTKEEIVAAGDINISFYTHSETMKVPIQFEELSELRAVDSTWKLDLLVQLTWSIRPLRPGWSGLMQMLQQGVSPGKSSVAFMPMIDMNPSDMSCIYTTLKFVSDHASRHGVHPLLTFDQPLYWKALNIIMNEPENSDIHKIVLRLGGFHTIMSFLGSIGHLMQGSGLNEVLETVYASNAVVHMMNGKAVARAIRGHLLVYRALSSILLKEIFSVPLPEENANNVEANPTYYASDNSAAGEQDNLCICENDEPVANDSIAMLGDIYDDLMAGKIDVVSVCELDLLNKLNDKLAAEKEGLQKFRTAALWLQYMKMVEIMQMFIKAERTGDWPLHLHSLSFMLPYFAAAGHNLYLKSAHVYLQLMQKLEMTNKDVYQCFRAGHHVVRRSDRFWAGLSTDLIIEQVLMRSVKTNGGLTRGKGLTESQRLQWLLSLPTCAEFNKALQDFSGTSYHTSNQHKESGQARKEKDFHDMHDILSFLVERNPFIRDAALRNIETGVTAETAVNADNAKDLGQKILKSMVGNNVMNFTFKKSKQTIVMNTKSVVKLGEESIQVDPQLLFQRLTTVVGRSEDEDISHVFEYELCSMPSALFDPCGLPRQAQKPAIADYIWSLGDCGPQMAEFHDLNVKHVLDGGSLLQRIPWQQGKTYGQICNAYVDYVTKKYVDPVIVFDGYNCGPSTKDITHIRRTHGIVGSNVSFKETTPFKGKKETFLTNTENKQKFINMLSSTLMEHGCTVLHAEDDADLLIAKTTVGCAKTHNIMLIGEDTDLLVLLCYHVDIDSFKVYFKSEGRQNASTIVKVWDIQKTKAAVGLTLCHLLPFLHAITGCDTTSRLFGIGKGAALKKLITDEKFQGYAETFNRKCTHSEVEKAGENAMVSLYGGLEIEGLNLLRVRKFAKKVTSSSTSVQVHTIPPTAAAARYHSLRVYYQVQRWIDAEHEILPVDWGWTVIDNKLIPIKTDLPAAPEKLLKIIKCNCKVNCDTRRCTCRKHGLECSIGCGECRGINCSNVANLTESDISEEL